MEANEIEVGKTYKDRDGELIKVLFKGDKAFFVGRRYPDDPEQPESEGAIQFGSFILRFLELHEPFFEVGKTYTLADSLYEYEVTHVDGYFAWAKWRGARVSLDRNNFLYAKEKL